MFIFILMSIIGAALIYLNYTGRLKLPQWVGFVVIGVGFLAWLLPEVLRTITDATRARTNNAVNATTGQNSCGCVGAVRVTEDRFLAQNRISQMSCSSALNLVGVNPNKWSITGCV